MIMGDNARAWYEYARKTGDDSVAKFMMYWIAFNFMYSDYCKLLRNGRRNSERNQIQRLCSDRRYELMHYNPFDEDTESVGEFLKNPVLEGRDRPSENMVPQLSPDVRKPPCRMDPEELWGVVCLGHGLVRAQCLLLTLYQVRCNLFHGSKGPDYPRDQDLVKAAAVIIHGYMKALLHIDRPF